MESEVKGSEVTGKGQKQGKGKNGAAAPPSDPAKEEIWRTGKALLTGQGMSRDNAGSYLGKLVKEYGQVLVLQAVRDCAATTPAEASGWLTARCQERRGTGGVEARNRAAADAFIAKGAPDATH